MEFTNNSLTWNDSTDKWDLNMTQISVASQNKGIPAFPYVYRVKLNTLNISKEFNKVKTTVESIIDAEVFNKATFVRVANRLDTNQLLSYQQLKNELLSFFEVNKYNGIVSDPEGDADPVTNLLTDLHGIATRVDSKDHLCLSGWVYFKHDDLVQEYTYYDEAKKAQNIVEYFLEGYVREHSNGLSPLYASISSVSPSRSFILNSLRATNLRAGDILRITVSGGSGDYEYTESSAALVQVDSNSWRIVENVTQALTLTVRDTNTEEVVILEITTEEK